MGRLVLATHNPKKAGEMRAILAELLPGWDIRSLAEFPDAPEPEETGTTYAENAILKAESACRVTGEWSLADDAGLEVDALDGAPGLHSKRFAGEDTPFPVKMDLILRALREVPVERRGARFHCCVAVARPHRPTRVFEATCEGRIADRPAGSGGFGYDPIFWLPERGCTMAELAPEEKNAVSHRGKVLRSLADWIRAGCPEEEAP